MPKSASLQCPSLSRRTLSNFRSLKGKAKTSRKKTIVIYWETLLSCRHRWIIMSNKQKALKLITCYHSSDANSCENVSLYSASSLLVLFLIISDVGRNLWRDKKTRSSEDSEASVAAGDMNRQLPDRDMAARKSLTHSDDHSLPLGKNCSEVNIYSASRKVQSWAIVLFLKCSTQTVANCPWSPELRVNKGLLLFY